MTRNHSARQQAFIAETVRDHVARQQSAGGLVSPTLRLRLLQAAKRKGWYRTVGGKWKHESETAHMRGPWTGSQRG